MDIRHRAPSFLRISVVPAARPLLPALALGFDLATTPAFALPGEPDNSPCPDEIREVTHLARVVADTSRELSDATREYERCMDLWVIVGTAACVPERAAVDIARNANNFAVREHTAAIGDLNTCLQNL